MKPFEKLTRTGQLRRLNRLAREALDQFGLPGSRLCLIRHAGNTLYRVTDLDPGFDNTDHDLFKSGQYLLRIHQPGYQAPDALKLELEWLKAMRRDTDLPVPEPVETVNGNLITSIETKGISGSRQCSLLRWVKGRLITKNIQSRHYRSQGRLMARLHDFSSKWQHPSGLTKRRFDYKGLFHDDSGAGIPASEVWSMLTASYYKPFDAVACRVKEVMRKLGKGPDVYGLIHADFGVDANVLFHGGEARGIDFDDSGFGYYIYDLGVALEHVRDEPRYAEYRDALLTGYGEYRRLHTSQVIHLELFMMATHVYWCLWALPMKKRYPHHSEMLQKRMNRSLRLVKQFVKVNLS